MKILEHLLGAVLLFGLLLIMLLSLEYKPNAPFLLYLVEGIIFVCLSLLVLVIYFSFMNYPFPLDFKIDLSIFNFSRLKDIFERSKPSKYEWDEDSRLGRLFKYIFGKKK